MDYTALGSNATMRIKKSKHTRLGAIYAIVWVYMALTTTKYQALYRECYLQYGRHNMVDKSKGETTTPTGEVTNIYDTVEQNCIRIVDEFIKTQPQYTQSASNL
ncbi:MAG TPA: hypothetical protein VEH06_04295 [Candidatus Bathyarchaeia archaeon]|nr:hypothetical protein [Candidatus Bathyarchaeia archaeon]